MPLLIDRRNVDFVLHEWLRVETLNRYPRYAEHSRATIDATIDLAAQIADDHFQSHNRKSDLQEPHWLPDGTVQIIPEVKAALAAYADAGFMSLCANEADGGLQMPQTVALAAESLFCVANASTSAYNMLSHGVANLLAEYGSAQQQRLYRTGLLQGRFMGTMCLSEPQAGSSLGDIKTTASPHADGSYRISGAKMWISGGDHELSDNIIHLVLAKIAGAPAGVKGISLFIVPRFHLHDDGSKGGRNDVALAGVNHKMGQRGIVNTFLKFGERGECVGHLVGEPNKGLAYMFHMMNAARIEVGVGAVMLGYAGYRYALGYAQERRQGRLPSAKDPSSTPVAIIEHPDVKRMLIQQKAWVEGAYGLALYAGTLLDVQGQDPSESVRAEAHLLLELLTPIVKAWSSDWMLKANELAIQVLGGYGFTREYPVEQFYRDNRINPIHEGTNGIQAIDLLGRKLMMNGGAALKLLAARIGETLAQAAHVPSQQAHGTALHAALQRCIATTQTVGAAMAAGQATQALAHAHHAIVLYGHTVVAWIWLQQALVANAASQAAPSAFYQGKLAACAWFFSHDLPATVHSAAVLQAMEPSLLNLTVEQF